MTAENGGSSSSALHLAASTREMKMVIYKIHIIRVFAASVTLLSLASLLIFLNPPQNCIQVSVSVQQWHPYHMKRSRLVQAVDESAAPSRPRGNFIAKLAANTDAFFRVRVVHPNKNNDSADREDDDGDENDAYGSYDDTVAYEYDSEFSDNKVFEDGDFDYNETNRIEPDFGVIQQMFNAYKLKVNSTSKVNFSSPNEIYNKGLSKYSARKRLKHRLRNVTLINIEGVPIVEDTIYWSKELEDNSPKGSEDSEAQLALQKLRSSKVKRVEPPTWNRCGRPKNQFVVFEDNSKACARYRAPHQYLVQGEILSFYLARLLGITNVPVVALSAVKEDLKSQWNSENVKKSLVASKWEQNTTVALIQWIDNLERDKLPAVLLLSLLNKKVLSGHSVDLLKLPVNKLVELLQWSDLIVFDYITGNYDRVASMQDAADKEHKPSILQETIHNLVRSKSTSALWLIDNESGLLDSYSLLYGPAGEDGRFLTFHEQMLNTTCVFRRTTVERIRWLHHTNRAGAILLNLVRQFEPLLAPIDKAEEISKRLQERIDEVHEHIENCLSYFS